MRAEKSLEFENGRLVKVGMNRPEYMSGHTLICLLKEMAADLKFLSDQSCIIEHEQDREAMANIRKKYDIRAFLEK